MEKIFEPVLFSHSSGNIFAYTVPGIPSSSLGQFRKSKLGLHRSPDGSLKYITNLNPRKQILPSRQLNLDKTRQHNSRHKNKRSTRTPSMQICSFILRNPLWQNMSHQMEEKCQSISPGGMKKKRKSGLSSANLWISLSIMATPTNKWNFPSIQLSSLTRQVSSSTCVLKNILLISCTLTLQENQNQSINRWVSNFKRNFLVVSNTHLTTKNQ